jgi:hypothetical protein
VVSRRLSLLYVCEEFYPEIGSRGTGSIREMEAGPLFCF